MCVCVCLCVQVSVTLTHEAFVRDVLFLSALQAVVDPRCIWSFTMDSVTWPWSRTTPVCHVTLEKNHSSLSSMSHPQCTWGHDAAFHYRDWHFVLFIILLVVQTLMRLWGRVPVWCWVKRALCWSLRFFVDGGEIPQNLFLCNQAVREREEEEG